MSNHYQDIYKRFHDKPVTPEDPLPCNNTFLYSGYAYLLGLVPNHGQPVVTVFARCQTEYGYNRHPEGDIFPASSHDEVVGMYMLTKMPKLTDKWEKQGWQVCNQPDFKPTPWHKLNWFKVIMAYFIIAYHMLTNKNYQPRHAVLLYPEIWPIAFKHAPQHVYFYKRCMGMNPGFYLLLHFFFASFYTIFFGGNSGKLMLGFKLRKISKKNNTEKLVNWVYHKKVSLKDEVKKYFPKDHPIVAAAEEKL